LFHPTKTVSRVKFILKCGKKIGSGSPWEDIVGYSRAIKIGTIIEVAGTTAMDGDLLVGKDDVNAQTVFIFQKIELALKELGSSLNDVVRTRMFVINIDTWQLVGEAHGVFFKTIKPVTTLVEVSRLINEELLIEIEVTAITTA